MRRFLLLPSISGDPGSQLILLVDNMSAYSVPFFHIELHIGLLGCVVSAMMMVYF